MRSDKAGSPTSVLVNDVGRYTLSMKSHSDMLYKQLFAHPEVVRDLLTGFVSAEWTGSLDIGAFERINASYTGDGGKARHEDIVWRAKIGGDWVYVYLLLEFQSRSDPWMALRMQVYVGLLCQDLVAQHRLSRHGKLPPVLPVVLYHGRKPWRASTDLAKLMLPPPEGLERYQPSQHYLLIDQHRNVGADGRSNVLAILFRLMRSHTDGEMREALRAFADRMKLPDMLPARDSLVRWVQVVLRDEFCETDMSLEEGPAMLFDKRFKKYEDLLEFEAIQRGRAEGVRLVLQDVLQEMTDDCKAELPADMDEKISAADVPQLRRWVKLLVGGAKPQQVFAGP
nr:Rpn family recombination-promoting nuclease/putative transposase [uncultured Duganella sp.]